MISEEKMLKNAKKFVDTGVKYGVVNDDLMDMLGPEFIKSPCTTAEHLYGAYEGGLINHILNVTKYAITVNTNLPEDKQVSTESIIRVCLLHQIGKAKMYLPQDNDWFIKNRGEHFKFNDETLPLNTGERSVFYALKCGIDLSEEEVYAIHSSTNDFGQKTFKGLGDSLAAILRVANQLAILSEK